MSVWRCANPEYIRTIENGTQVFLYRFRITEAPYDILTVSKGMSQESLTKALLQFSLTDDEYKTYLTDFFQYILGAHSRLFNKKYTPQQYVKSLIHQFNNLPIVDGDPTMEHTCSLKPVELVLKNGRLFLKWSVELANMVDFNLEEDVVAEVSPAPQSISFEGVSKTPAFSFDGANKGIEGELLEVDDVDDVSEEEDVVAFPTRSGQGGVTGVAAAANQTMSDKQFRDRQRIEEARLRAKLAAVRAERAIERYIEKYGDYETDEDDATSADSE